jgi:hypothetical protein
MTIVEMLLAQSARVGEPNDPCKITVAWMFREARKCESVELSILMVSSLLDDEILPYYSSITQDTDTDRFHH